MIGSAKVEHDRLANLGRAALPVLAIVSFALAVGATISVAGNTLGYDYQAYVTAAGRLVHGQALYDPAVNVAGPFAVYLYPPPFAVAFVPFAVVPSSVGLWAWIAGCVAMTLAAIALLPVGSNVRWWILLLAALDWPVAYAIKLGQIAPFLLLVFAIGWRSLKNDAVVGTIGGVGGLVKLQPALVFGWALLSRRWTAIVAGLLMTGVFAILTLPIVGLGAWADFVQTIGRVSAPVTTPHVMTVGAVAYQNGVSQDVATAIQFGAMMATTAFWAFACLRRSPDVGYITTIVASQLLSPLLWDHYAVLLLLPVAWLLENRRRWAALIPLATSIPLVDVTPSFAYPIAFFVCLVAPALTARRAGA